MRFALLLLCAAALPLACRTPGAGSGGADAASAVKDAPGSAGGAQYTIYCTQSTPARTSGAIILEDGVMTQSGDRYSLKVTGLGFGLLGMQGDGTGDRSLIDSDGAPDLQPDPRQAARSPQWRNALPFVLPVNQAAGQHVMYVKPDAFGPAQEFSARLKVTPRGGREKNFGLLCQKTGGGQTQPVEWKNLYCSQRTPARNSGIILEDAAMAMKDGKAHLKVMGLGFGILNQEGDGTGDQSLISVDDNQAPEIQENAQYAARSPQWRDAAPFLLPIQGGTYVLYIKRNAFQGAADFEGRLSITRQGRAEENIGLACNHI